MRSRALTNILIALAAVAMLAAPSLASANEPQMQVTAAPNTTQMGTCSIARCELSPMAWTFAPTTVPWFDIRWQAAEATDAPPIVELTRFGFQWYESLDLWNSAGQDAPSLRENWVDRFGGWIDELYARFASMRVMDSGSMPLRFDDRPLRMRGSSGLVSGIRMAPMSVRNGFGLRLTFIR